MCGCDWSKHKHITYEYTISRSEIRRPMTLADIDRLIDDLEGEAAKIRDVYRKLAGFLHANAILPINDEIVDYLKYFIREEEMKQSAGAHNTKVIESLKGTMDEFKHDMDLFKTTLKDQNTTTDQLDIPKPDEIFTLVGTLYRLPINGQQIREQVNGINAAQEKCGAGREVSVTLPGKAARSKVMTNMREITSAN